VDLEGDDDSRAWWEIPVDGDLNRAAPCPCSVQVSAERCADEVCVQKRESETSRNNAVMMTCLIPWRP
jgi:hypothetical protein